MYRNISPIDHRYYHEELVPYLSEDAFINYKKLAELALIRTLCDRKMLSEDAYASVVDGVAQVKAEDVYAEENKTRHDIRALVNCLRDKVNDEAKPFIHLAATSYDIVESANALRYKLCFQEVIIPSLVKIIELLIQKSKEYADVPQIGRTHGQHAVPITVGFFFANHLVRIGGAIISLDHEVRCRLRGKFSGAVGAYNALSLLVDDPEEFEKEFIKNMGIERGDISTQIVHPEHLISVIHQCQAVAGALANLADDIRHLQRTEIGEFYDKKAEHQVGSSTMPHKANPIAFENIKGCWKILMGRLVTVYMDQISEHQRDLTNSSTMRTYGEIFAYLHHMSLTMHKALEKLQINTDSLNRNLYHNTSYGAEILYILLAKYGHPNAHEKARQLISSYGFLSNSLHHIARDDEDTGPYMAKFTHEENSLLQNPAKYTGKAKEKTLKVVKHWGELLECLKGEGLL